MQNTTKNQQQIIGRLNDQFQNVIDNKTSNSYRQLVNFIKSGSHDNSVDQNQMQISPKPIIDSNESHYN